MNKMILTEGDIVVVTPGEAVDFECLESGSNTVVKVPSSKDDKYIV
jgi:hypothetical protein